jgi:hypothetical protein
VTGAANGWVGTRTLWNQHTYHVSNICDDRDSACHAPNRYGAIPKAEIRNWNVAWLNNFRQNVQDRGVFDAPDATVSLAIPECASPVVLRPSVRNVGLASLPAGVVVEGVVLPSGKALGRATTTRALLPGQLETLSIQAMPGDAAPTDSFQARIVLDPMNPTFRQCRDDNDASGIVKASCIQ